MTNDSQRVSSLVIILFKRTSLVRLTMLPKLALGVSRAVSIVDTDTRILRRVWFCISDVLNVDTTESLQINNHEEKINNIVGIVTQYY